jgi:hypothetical protein
MRPPSFRPRPRRPATAPVAALGGLVLLALLGAATGCDRVRELAANGGGAPPSSDPATAQWRTDSTFLANGPGMLFRVVRSETGTRAIPLTRLGRDFGVLGLGPRGWRAFDVAYLYGGRPFTPLRTGTPLPAITSRRGMWEGDPLDSLPGCRFLLPGADVTVPDGVELLVAGRPPRFLPAAALSAAAVDDALQTLTTLVAPSAGIGMAALRQFRRTLHVVPAGASGRPALLALYQDPRPLPDSTDRLTLSPRFLAVLLEPGAYGFRAAWQYSTQGVPGAPPALEFLGYLDADGDGGTELFFGAADARVPLHLLVLRHDGTRWVESMRSARGRCTG